ncbi:FeoA family protein [Bifidobacterium criceti]|uniref:Ferrous iron transport protein A n=1 Tax=Bifidobacterium criceti TaxID=1960969 RepID=A0A2A2EE38_9BIFI|nr:FeoA family protein [Bifidobacterium criceti]PAU67250.1 Ferrous iron transport protein A [Bifidobacterium criceti]
MDTSSPLTVEHCPLDADMTITAIDIDERHRFRMLELGLRVGTIIRVIQKSNFGGRVIAKGTERIAIDGHTAARVAVTPAEGV